MDGFNPLKAPATTPAPAITPTTIPPPACPPCPETDWEPWIELAKIGLGCQVAICIVWLILHYFVKYQRDRMRHGHEPEPFAEAATAVTTVAGAVAPLTGNRRPTFMSRVTGRD